MLPVLGCTICTNDVWDGVWHTVKTSGFLDPVPHDGSELLSKPSSEGLVHQSLALLLTRGESGPIGRSEICSLEEMHPLVLGNLHPVPICLPYFSAHLQRTTHIQGRGKLSRLENRVKRTHMLPMLE
jgi:hypothetical protein